MRLSEPARLANGERLAGDEVALVQDLVIPGDFGRIRVEMPGDGEQSIAFLSDITAAKARRAIRDGRGA